MKKNSVGLLFKPTSVFVSKYQLYLPNKKELEDKVKELISE